MTKWLMVGMSLRDCVERTTSAPAEAIGWGDRIGTLGVGRAADISVFELAPVDVMLEDCQSQLRHCRQRLVCRAVWKGGEPFTLTQPKAWPNPETVALQRPAWEVLQVRDATPPPLPDPSLLAALGDRVVAGPRPPTDDKGSAEGTGDWNPRAGFAGLMSLLGEGGSVWSARKRSYVWNPLEFEVTKRRATMAAACACPVCFDPQDVASRTGQWACSIVFDGDRAMEARLDNDDDVQMER
jgi:hypothetical protein